MMGELLYKSSFFCKQMIDTVLLINSTSVIK